MPHRCGPRTTKVVFNDSRRRRKIEPRTTRVKPEIPVDDGQALGMGGNGECPPTLTESDGQTTDLGTKLLSERVVERRS